MATQVMAKMHSYIPLFYVDVITYPCPNLDADLINLCQLKMPWTSMS